jgi:hypothetical protein
MYLAHVSVCYTPSSGRAELLTNLARTLPEHGVYITHRNVATISLC